MKCSFEEREREKDDLAALGEGIPIHTADAHLPLGDNLNLIDEARTTAEADFARLGGGISVLTEDAILPFSDNLTLDGYTREAEEENYPDLSDEISISTDDINLAFGSNATVHNKASVTDGDEAGLANILVGEDASSLTDEADRVFISDSLLEDNISVTKEDDTSFVDEGISLFSETLDSSLDNNRTLNYDLPRDHDSDISNLDSETEEGGFITFKALDLVFGNEVTRDSYIPGESAPDVGPVSIKTQRISIKDKVSRNTSPHTSTPGGIDIEGIASENNADKIPESSLKNTQPRVVFSGVDLNLLAVQLPLRRPETTPQMATFEVPYDDSTPSPSTSCSSSSLGSNNPTQPLPRPPQHAHPAPHHQQQRRSQDSSLSHSSASSFHTAEHPSDVRNVTPEPAWVPDDPQPTPQPTPNSADEGYLETTAAETEYDLISALQLIADSVAQQRQIAANSILGSFYYWALFIVVFQYLYSIFYYTSADWIIIIVSTAIFGIFSLSGIQFWTSGYLDEAERVGRWSWLFGSQWVSNFNHGDGDEVGQNHRTDYTSVAPLIWTSCQGIWFRVPGGHVEKILAWCGAKSELKKKKVLKSKSVDGVSSMGKAWEQYSSGTSPRDTATCELDVLKLSLEEGWQEDKVFVSRFNGRVIATLVVRIVPVDTDSAVIVPRDDDELDSDLYADNRPVYPSPAQRPEKVVIRAWTVLQKYRGHGVGQALLQFAIQYARELGLQGPEFAIDHANALRVLPTMFSYGMDKSDKRARRRLDQEIRKFVPAN
ncbi:hypothetical protein N7466_006508 [Penicillium verhagenii]|uniref:uncharacterized protein n=1 Tax=Penicillium verhagenii TaxID=1562060 RepID=UPI0025452434|nr:uncharacterized protein N7466_006508 [Penicillium verhagenii]KAJ5931015.1 hypothetical protein N7466_006508 [Penicillium verhagenii]